MNVGFIGCGNMATAIISGVIKSKVHLPENILCYDVDENKVCDLAEKFGVKKCTDEADVVRRSNYVILAVKPNVLPNVLKKIDSALSEKETVLISIAAGKSIESISNELTHANKIIRVMPNINAKVSCSSIAYCTNNYVSETNIQFVKKLFSSVGNIMQLNEEFFPVFGVLSGCAPAYTFLFIEALANSGLKYGLPKKDALNIAAQTVMGSAKMILENDVNTQELIDSVCSPGGTTIEGIMSLKSDSFEGIVAKAFDKSLDKDKRL